MVRQFLVFASVGAVGTLVHYCVLITLVTFGLTDAVLGSAFGFVSGAFTNYILNYRITFQSRKRHIEALPKFFTVAVAGLVLNTAIMALAFVKLNLHYLIAQAIATGIVLLWNFVGNRIWTFSKDANA